MSSFKGSTELDLFVFTRFYLGGPTSVRGFSMYSIGPQSDGLKLLNPALLTILKILVRNKSPSPVLQLSVALRELLPLRSLILRRVISLICHYMLVHSGTKPSSS